MLNIRKRNIRGKVIVTCSKNGEFKSLSKEQAIQYQMLLNEESFKYERGEQNARNKPLN